MLKCAAFTGVLLASSHLLSGTPSLETRVELLEANMQEKNRVQPVIKAPNVFSIDASYLFWRAFEDGLEFAYQSTGPSLTVTNSTKNLDFGWDSGFRLGVGYRLPYDAWQLTGQWSHLHSHATGTLMGSNTRSIWNNAFVDTLGINTNLNIHLNVWDGEISRYIQLSSHVGIKPHFGVRGLTISQKYIVSKIAHVANTTVKVPAEHSSRSRGVGLRAGVDTGWEFYKDFSLYANIGGSLLATSFNLVAHPEFPLSLNKDPAIEVTYQENIHTTLVPTLDLALGIAYEHSFSGKAALGIQAGWEFNDFFNQNRLTSLVASLQSNTNSFGSFYANDLTYQGLTLKIKLDF